MQNIEQNMDDLFRKAAEHYIPQPDKDRWSEIAPQLFANPVVSASPIAVKSHNHKKLFLLFPFAAALLGAFVLNNGLNRAEVKKPIAQSQQLQSKMANSSLKKKANSMYVNENNKQTKALLPGLNEARNKTTFKQDNNNTNKKIADIEIISDKKDQRILILDSLHLLSGGYVADSSRSNAAVVQSLAHTDSVSSLSSPSSKKTITTKKARFYAGLVAGSAFNQVKNQGFKKAGFDIGLLAGYRIAKKVSLEASIISSEKSYFSNGRYFSMSKMPANMKVISLTGNTHVFEVPVVVKYDFIRKKSSAMFAVAGVSSYFLTKENNNYVAVINGTQQNMTGSYKKVSAGVASSIHLGFGYEHQLGKQTSVRAEPYLQIPLKGIGIGNMQVMSAGVHVAMTLPIH